MPIKPDEMIYLLLPLVLLVAQGITLGRMLMLLARRGQPISSGLARSFGIWLIVAPGFELMFYQGVLAAIAGPASRSGLLETLGQEGILIGAYVWVGLAVWMSTLLVEPEKLYRHRRGIAPVICLAMLAATFSATYLGYLAGALPHLLDASSGLWMTALMAGTHLLAFIIPTAPLAGLVLLIIHVARVPRSGGRVTLEASGNESESEGDMP